MSAWRRLALGITWALAVVASRASAQDLVHEKSVSELATDLAAGRVTSVQLVDAYLARIAAYDKQGPALNAIITLNPRARAEASERDADRRAGRVRGALHGIPVLVKDNYGTVDMPTSAGSIALAGFQTGRDAFQVTKLRAAGAIILGKTNMHELASGVTNVSSLGGQTCNPYDPTRIPGGSSGGTGAAIAASFAAIGWGSDTCGSIRIPAASNNLFGLRPTKGLSSIAGIIPLSHTQDVAAPLARTVMDLAIGLDATSGMDAADPATAAVGNARRQSFVNALNERSMFVARIGVLSAFFGNQPDDVEAAGIVRAALDRMRATGAEIVEIEIPGLDTLIQRAGVIDHEFKFDFEDYMAASPSPPVRSLQEIIDRGLYHSAIDASLKRRNAIPSRDSEAYRAALARREVARQKIMDLLIEKRLTGLAYPTVRRKPTPIGRPQPPGNCQLSAVTGLPAITMPAGFTTDSLPIGLEILGAAFSDAELVSLAYSYEQATRPRRAPRTTPPLPNSPKR